MLSIWITVYDPVLGRHQRHLLEEFDDPDAARDLYEECVDNINESNGLLRVVAAYGEEIIEAYPMLH